MPDDPNEYCGDGGRLLELIKELLAENLAIMKMNGTNSDYLDGMNNGLKELAIELGIATYEELLD